MDDTWGGKDLSLEKLKIHARLEAIEKHIVADKEDTKLFRDELKEMMKSQHTILFGDGDTKKGLVTRMVESENAHRAHAKFTWTAITVSMGLAITSFWNLITGHK